VKNKETVYLSQKKSSLFGGSPVNPWRSPCLFLGKQGSTLHVAPVISLPTLSNDVYYNRK